MTIEAVEELDADIDRVWSYIGDFGGLRRWHPNVIACDVQVANAGTQRVVQLDGWHATERLGAYDPASYTLGYEMVDCGRPGLIGIRGLMRLEPLDANRCRIRWHSELPAGASPELDGIMRAYYPERIGHLRDALLRDAGTNDA